MNECKSERVTESLDIKIEIYGVRYTLLTYGKQSLIITQVK